ncbi:transcription initiation factor TFIIIB [Tepidibacter mesophilus]|uniref:transcription initiation factor TFIIIB n=1 Tax=Tepidibacter mesophilus TaxID=655607 RepID=UPI000C070E45|nr:transcription initiation factor TFIIIB [Tepidibacter mesophilus]
MEKQRKECPECGCKEIGQGKLPTVLRPINAVIASSEVRAEVCTNCGYILNMRVLEPEKFKKSLI